jgi:caa(3)-type oxidase subunit IV
VAGSLLLTRTTAVWGVLILATVSSWWLGTDHGLGSGSDHRAATVVILTVALLKVRLVGLYFMELRGAHLALRILFEVYCAGVCAALLVGYLVF